MSYIIKIIDEQTGKIDATMHVNVPVLLDAMAYIVHKVTGGGDIKVDPEPKPETHLEPAMIEKKKRGRKKKVVEQDTEEKETPARGKRIMPEDIRQMKAEINNGVSVREIAEEFGVSEQTIYVLKRKMADGVM